MITEDLKKFDMPDSPGVYFFKRGREILYVGKASSLCDRVKSYFSKDIFLSRGPRIVKMLEEANSVDFAQTDSVLEALILEANEIKKHQPIYNAREKDDKSYNYVVLTKEDFPKILIQRGRDLEYGLPREALAKWGPFPHSGELREALKIIRKIFPYRDVKCKLTPLRAGRVGKPCFNAQIGFCPGPCAGWISKGDYRKQIRNIKLFFEGKKDALIKTLEKEMRSLAKAEEFEKAEEIKKKIFALDHIQDVALIKQDLAPSTKNLGPNFRIEAYDIAHISGTNAVGVMTVVEDGELNKSQYRKFRIRSKKGADDTDNLKEIIDRRLNHPEWPMPNLIVVDGGAAQLNVATEVLKLRSLEVPVVSVVKDERHKAREILGLAGKGQTLSINSKGLTLKSEALEKSILIANSEAHRFAISYHRKLRGKGFRI
ncbi:MAG: UvrB/UvrC motif-containing protein [bacterium]|nr:UvrB/UvrC motif-containing protein [bacterium]